MSRKRHKPEEIVAKLRQVDVLTSQGQTVADAVRVTLGLARHPVVARRLARGERADVRLETSLL